MDIKTLIIGHVPLTDTAGVKSKELRGDKYFKELFSNYNLGDVHYTNHKDWRAKVDEVNPLVIIYLGSEYSAEEIHQGKKDAMLYVMDDTGTLFYRKAEIAEKMARHKTILTEIAGIIQKIRDGEEKDLAAARQFASMSYDDMYRMIKQSIIGEDDKLRKSAWELLNSNDGHKNFIWMRSQLMLEVWQHCDGKGKEEFLCMAMDQEIEEGMVRKLDNFTDGDGQQYHQYMLCDFFGRDFNYIRRIPFGTKGQDKWAYQAILDKYQTPNGLQMMIEAGQIRTEKAKYFKTEAEKVYRILKDWKEDPTKSKLTLGILPWNPEDSEKDQLAEREVESLKKFLQKHDQSAFEFLFEIKK